MILTIKIKHETNLSVELKKAKQVAIHALKYRSRSSKDVKHIGLKSAISNQVLKKYSSNMRLKRVNRVKLTVPGQSVKNLDNEIKVPCLSLVLSKNYFRYSFDNIKQIEFDKTYAYVTGEVKELKQTNSDKFIGVDLNTKGHCAVIGIPDTGKVIKLG
jgi:transposase